MKIKIYDAIMGSGKTTKLIEDISNLPITSKVMYIAPLLSECHRVAGTSYDPEDERKTPITVCVDEVTGVTDYMYDTEHKLSNRRFRHPSLGKTGSKLDALLEQIKHGCNIVSTHALFRSLTPEVITEIKKQNYILVLDEVLSVYESFEELQWDETVRLFENNILKYDEDGITLVFNKEQFGNPQGTRYEEIANLCELRQLLCVDGKIVIWEFPLSALQAFTDVWIGTYLFSGSQMCAYLKSYGVEFETVRFGRKPSEIAHLIELVEDDKLNKVGAKPYALSHSDLTDKKSSNEILRKNINTFFRSKYKTKPEERLWTTYKKASGSISGGRYAKVWLAFNTKATNEYKDTKYVAYLCNLFIQPPVVKLLAHKGVSIDPELYALSEMVQFIWRSQIRSGEKIALYLPSSRMRRFLTEWLTDKYD